MVWNCTDIVPGSLFDWLTLIVLFRGGGLDEEKFARGH
jgi:hypothetical protein